MAQMYLPRSLLFAAVFVFCAFCLLWPALYNGGPFLDSDTPGYIRYADVAVSKITKQPSEWSQSRVVNHADRVASSPVDGDSTINRNPPFLGRSIYYGMLLRLGDAYGMMWPSIAAQAVALLLAVALTIWHAIGFKTRTFVVFAYLLAISTPVAFFASRLMPDVFAGIVILAIANLIVYGARMSRACLLAWIALLSAGLLVHGTHVLIALSLFVLYLLEGLLFRRSASWIGLAGVLFGILVAFAGEAAFIMATKRAFGVAPIRPPFLTARVIADGPGDAYLQANCPSSGFIVCRFINRLPISNSDTFLWSSDPAEGGVFTPADPEMRRALSAEQFRFVVAVLRYDPLGELSAIARNTLDQSQRVSVSDFNLDSQDKDEFQRELPPRYLTVAERTRSWRDTMPLALMSAIILIVLLLSGAYLAWALLLRGHRSADDNHLKRLAVIIILGILVNAFVCGAMSKPYNRYQSRVVWLIPFVAGMLYQQRSRQIRHDRDLSSL